MCSLIVSIVQRNNNILHEDCCSKSEAYFIFCFGKRNNRYCMLYVLACVTLHNFWRFLIIRMNAILFDCNIAIFFFNLQTSLAIAILFWVALYTDRVNKIILYYLCRLVFKRNKMHDREIALWNARMRISFDANFWEMNSEEYSLSMLDMVSGDQHHLAHGQVQLCAEVRHYRQWLKILAKESFGMSQPAAAISITNMMNPHLFFLRSFHFFSSRPACLALW